jgi:hypothetical protein
MNIQCILKIFIVALCFIFLVEADSQNAAVSWSSFNMGYTASSSSGTIARSVVGQSFVGRMRENDKFIESGFLADTLFRGSIVGVIDEMIVPTEFRLEQNYPNPFNPRTTIHFQLPSKSHVTLRVYDILGQELETLINEEREAGMYILQYDGLNLTSGIYFYRLQAGSYSETKKLILLK